MWIVALITFACGTIFGVIVAAVLSAGRDDK